MEALSRRIHAAVIGGVNMDIWGRPSGMLRIGDSNPGRVMLRPGGVGRNIAHNLKLLGADVVLYSAVGEDFNGRSLVKSCSELDMDVSRLRIIPDVSTSTYLYITDSAGDMYAAVNDMESSRYINASYLAGHIDEINRADAVVIDANIPEDAIEYLAQNCEAPMYADPVSAAKAAKLEKLLPVLEGIKPNALEAQILSGCDSPEEAAEELLAKGVKKVFITLGRDGILAACGAERIRQSAVKADCVNSTGAGDAAAAAIVWASAQGMSLENTALAAAAAGAVTASSEMTNSPELSAGKLKQCIRKGCL